MLAYLTKSGIRALAASIVTGSLLIYATGGLNTPYVTPLVGVSIATFFIFWIAFALFFARQPRVESTQRSAAA